VTAAARLSTRRSKPCGRRDEHMPFLKHLVEGQIGPVTFAEIADGLASVDVSGHDPEWREVWQSGGRSGPSC